MSRAAETESPLLCAQFFLTQNSIEFGSDSTEGGPMTSDIKKDTQCQIKWLQIIPVEKLELSNTQGVAWEVT